MYLQVDPAVSQKLMTGRYHGDESRKDVHEKDIEYLARSRRAAEYCAVHLAGPPSIARKMEPCAPSRRFRPRCGRWRKKNSDNRENGRDTIDVSFDAAVG